MKLLQGQIRKYATSPFPEIRKDDTLGKTIFAALEDMQSSGTLKSERVLTTPQGPWIRAFFQCVCHSGDRARPRPDNPSRLAMLSGFRVFNVLDDSQSLELSFFVDYLTVDMQALRRRRAKC